MPDNSKALEMHPGFAGPVVIGGVGGSGTRVVAEIVQKLGIFLGDDLNESLDNLSYTLLFKRKAWYTRYAGDLKRLEPGLRILEKRLLSRERLNSEEYLFLARATLSMVVHGNNQMHAQRGLWPLVRAFQILSGMNDKPTAGSNGWGWKEPNSHVLLSHLNEFYPGLKYIHCVRNGIDMAFSKNQQQLFNWGDLFGVSYPLRPEDLPAASFRYWSHANRTALDIGKVMGPGRFLLLNFDSLCHEPRRWIQTIDQFLETNAESALIMELAAIPVKPSTTGRYQGKDISWVGGEDRILLREMGFIVPD